MLGCVVLVLLAFAGAAPARGLITGITNPTEPDFAERDGITAYHVAHAAGMRVVRLPVNWGDVVKSVPANATDPNDPAYDWIKVDDRLDRIVANGLQPLISVVKTPTWAATRPGGKTPHASDLGAFMTALARRYDGTSRHRVRLWQLWNEPNLKTYLDTRGAPEAYRSMLAAAHAAVHAVHDDNVLVGGGLGPFGGPRGRYGMAPLKFMRRLFRRETRFDVWSHHPYTSGPPTRSAYAKDDASLGDLGEIRRLLRRAERAGRIGSTRLWVTEFSWDSKPPDPYGVPVREHARWVAEALYRLWRHGVGVAIWFQLRDNPHDGHLWGQTFQSGLFYRTTALYSDERPKPALRAFRFPFVALPAGDRIRFWGRTPNSQPTLIRVERRVRAGWRAIRVVRADGDGIFTGTLPTDPRRRALRANVVALENTVADHSVPFVPRRTRDRLVNPFGGDDSEALRERD